jgi:hypothetical protein
VNVYGVKIRADSLGVGSCHGSTTAVVHELRALQSGPPWRLDGPQGLSGRGDENIPPSLLGIRLNIYAFQFSP